VSWAWESWAATDEEVDLESWEGIWADGNGWDENGVTGLGLGMLIFFWSLIKVTCELGHVLCGGVDV
jgi:hypothetical protein